MIQRSLLTFQSVYQVRYRMGFKSSWLYCRRPLASSLAVLSEWEKVEGIEQV